MSDSKFIVGVTEANYDETVVNCPKTVLLAIGAPVH